MPFIGMEWALRLDFSDYEEFSEELASQLSAGHEGASARQLR
jgi:hypothetical protein